MVSAATREQLGRVNDSAGMLELLKIEHPSITTAYVVNDTRSWTIGSTTWVGLPFRCKLPAQASGQAPRAQIEVDNIGRSLTDELEALPPNGVLLGTFYLVSRKNPEVIDSSFSAPLSGVSVTMATLNATLGSDEELRAPAVKVRYDLATTPALFEG